MQDGWGALYDTLKLSQNSAYPCNTLKTLTVTIGASLLTESQDPKVLLYMFQDQVLIEEVGEVSGDSVDARHPSSHRGIFYCIVGLIVDLDVFSSRTM